MSLDEFIHQIRLEEESQRYWHMIQTHLRRGSIIYYSENINDRLLQYTDQVDEVKKHPYPKELYNFINDNESHIRTLLELQGLTLEKHAHDLGGLPKYHFVYSVGKIDTLKENKYISTRGSKACDGFLLALLAINTNLGQYFIKQDEFIERLLQDPIQICHRNVERLTLYNLFEVNATTITDKADRKLNEQIIKRFKELKRDGYVQEVMLQTGEHCLSLAPGACLWDSLNRQIREELEGDSDPQ